MGIKLSGPLSLSSDISIEFVDEAPHALSEFYRGGDRVPDIPINANVPSSGEIGFGDLYGAVKSTAPVIPAGVIVFYDSEGVQSLPLRWQPYTAADGYFIKGSTSQLEIGNKIEKSFRSSLNFETDFSGQHGAGITRIAATPVSITETGAEPFNSYTDIGDQGLHKHLINLNLAELPTPAFTSLKAAISTGPVQNLPANAVTFGETQPSSIHQAFTPTHEALMIGDFGESAGVPVTYQGFTAEAGAHKHVSDNLSATKSFTNNVTIADASVTSGSHFHDFTTVLSVPQIKTKLLNAWKSIQESRATPSIIYPFSGDVSSLLENWYLCDGTNDTVDMREFFVGISPSSELHGTISGSQTNKLTATTTIAGGLDDDWLHGHNTQLISGFAREASVFHQPVNVTHRHVVNTAEYDNEYVPPHVNLAFIQYRPPVTYDVTISAQQVDEGQEITFTIVTSGLPYLHVLYWNLSATSGLITESDIVGGTIEGTTTIDNDQAIVTLTLNDDISILEGVEIIKLQVRSGSNQGPVVAESPEITVSDTSAATFTIEAVEQTFYQATGNFFPGTGFTNRVYYFSESGTPQVVLKASTGALLDGRSPTVYWKIIPGATDYENWWSYDPLFISLLTPLDIDNDLTQSQGSLPINGLEARLFIPFVKDVAGSGVIENFRVQFYGDAAMTDLLKESEELLVWEGSFDQPLVDVIQARQYWSNGYTIENSIRFVDLDVGAPVPVSMTLINVPNDTEFNWEIIDVDGFPAASANYFADNSRTGTVTTKLQILAANGRQINLSSPLSQLFIETNPDAVIPPDQLPVFKVRISSTEYNLNKDTGTYAYYRLRPRTNYIPTIDEQSVLVQTRFDIDTETPTNNISGQIVVNENQSNGLIIRLSNPTYTFVDGAAYPGGPVVFDMSSLSLPSNVSLDTTNTYLTNQSLFFDGSQDSLILGIDFDLTTAYGLQTTITVDTWVYVNSAASSMTPWCLVNEDQYIAPFLHQTFPVSDILRAGWLSIDTTGSSGASGPFGPAVAIHQWILLSHEIEYDGSVTRVRRYVNGNSNISIGSGDANLTVVGGANYAMPGLPTLVLGGYYIPQQGETPPRLFGKFNGLIGLMRVSRGLRYNSTTYSVVPEIWTPDDDTILIIK